MKDKYIAAKERWVAKQAGPAQRVVRSVDRLPPGQREVANFPVLDMGIQPEVARADWRLKIHGLVENPVTLDWEQFMALEQFAATAISTASPRGVSTTWNGAPVPVEHGGPARVIIPKLYAWKGAKWASEIIFLDRDILGFWEVRGYSNTADPWTDDRFA